MTDDERDVLLDPVSAGVVEPPELGEEVAVGVRKLLLEPVVVPLPVLLPLTLPLMTLVLVLLVLVLALGLADDESVAVVLPGGLDVWLALVLTLRAPVDVDDGIPALVLLELQLPLPLMLPREVPLEVPE